LTIRLFAAYGVKKKQGQLTSWLTQIDAEAANKKGFIDYLYINKMEKIESVCILTNPFAKRNINKKRDRRLSKKV